LAYQHFAALLKPATSLVAFFCAVLSQAVAHRYHRPLYQTNFQIRSAIISLLKPMVKAA